MRRDWLVRLAAAGMLLAAPALAQAPAAPAAGAPRDPFAAIRNAKPREVTNSVGMTFVEVPQGSFVMGRYAPACAVANSSYPSPMGRPVDWTAEDYARCPALARSAYRPGFVAEVPEPIMMGKYEVTQAQFERVMGFNPSYAKATDAADADRRPVDSVSWQDAKAFVDKLNALEKTNVYRLPTEAEWEWSSRAGMEPRGPWVVFNFGNDANGVFDRASPDQVGTKAPNGFGLYDTLGNVWEWVADVYNDKALADPKPPQSGSAHVVKGGSFMRGGNMTFSTDRGAGPGNRIDVGFRVLRRAEP